MKFLNVKINLSRKIFRPRVETQYWVSKAIEIIKKKKYLNKNLIVLDIFSGSGCIGIFLLKNLENIKRVDFVDIDKEALFQIKDNLKLNKIKKEKYKIIKSNIFSNLKGKKYDLIFANPPYVAKNRIFQVSKEVLENDPLISLIGGENGLFYIRKFLKELKKHLKKHSLAFMEFDPGQKMEIEKILKSEKLKFSFQKDQFRKYRYLIIFT